MRCPNCAHKYYEKKSERHNTDHFKIHTCKCLGCFKFFYTTEFISQKEEFDFKITRDLMEHISAHFDMIKNPDAPWPTYKKSIIPDIRPMIETGFSPKHRSTK